MERQEKSVAEAATYHLVVDLVEVDLADFVHHVFALERHKGKTCSNTKKMD